MRVEYVYGDTLVFDFFVGDATCVEILSNELLVFLHYLVEILRRKVRTGQIEIISHRVALKRTKLLALFLHVSSNKVNVLTGGAQELSSVQARRGIQRLGIF